jgi:hypothetical protein
MDPQPDHKNKINATEFVQRYGNLLMPTIADLVVNFENLGESIEYPELAADNKRHYRIFITYVCRHYLASKYDIVPIDPKAESQAHGLIVDHYDIYKNNKNTFDILPCIYTTSYCDMLFFQNNGEPPRRMNKHHLGNPKNATIQPPLKNRIKCYLDSLPTTQPEITPNLMHKGIFSDADVIIGNTMVDFRVSEFPIGKKIADFRSAFVCATIANLYHGHKINKLEIFNPLIGYVASVDLSSWDKWCEIDDLFNSVMNFSCSS